LGRLDDEVLKRSGFAAYLHSDEMSCGRRNAALLVGIGGREVVAGTPVPVYCYRLAVRNPFLYL
jgi:hypothetical protein